MNRPLLSLLIIFTLLHTLLSPLTTHVPAVSAAPTNNPARSTQEVLDYPRPLSPQAESAYRRVQAQAARQEPAPVTVDALTPTSSITTTMRSGSHTVYLP